jgi:hypothetical protein
VVNAKFFFSELVIAFNSSGKHRSLDVLTGKVLGEKPAQSAVNNNQHIATADIPVPSDFFQFPVSAVFLSISNHLDMFPSNSA